MCSSLAGKVKMKVFGVLQGLFALGLGIEDSEVPINNEIVTTRSSIALPLKTRLVHYVHRIYNRHSSVWFYRVFQVPK